MICPFLRRQGKGSCAEIPIVEHMRGLEQLPDSGFRFFAAPVKVNAFGTFPVRTFAIVER